MDTKRIERILWIIAVLLALNIVSNVRLYDLKLVNDANTSPGLFVGYRLNTITGEVTPIPFVGKK